MQRDNNLPVCGFQGTCIATDTDGLIECSYSRDIGNKQTCPVLNEHFHVGLERSHGVKLFLSGITLLHMVEIISLCIEKRKKHSNVLAAAQQLLSG